MVVCDRMSRTCTVVYCSRMSVLYVVLIVTECLGPVLLYIMTECQYYGHDCCLWQNARRLLWPVPLSIVTERQYCCLDCCMWLSARTVTRSCIVVYFDRMSVLCPWLLYVAKCPKVTGPVLLHNVTECQDCGLDRCMWQSARTVTRSSIVVYCDRMSVLCPWLLYVAKCPKVTRTCTVAYWDRMSVLWSWLLYVTECQDGYYGQDCSTSCSCTAANTASCDHVTGTCSCKAGWEGSTCSSDVNECLRRQHDCTGAYEECVNDVGGYHCVCAAGYYYKYFRVCQGMCVHTRSGELRTQKLKFHLVRTESLNVFPFKPEVGQYIAIHATLTARDFFLAYFYTSGPFTCIFFQNLSRLFLCWLWLAYGSCVGPHNEIGHPDRGRFPCWMPAEYK